MRIPYEDYALVFSGGGALGAWEVGCLRYLLEFHDQKAPNIVSGASAGALNAAGYHVGLTPDQLAEFWEGITKEDIFVDDLDIKAVAVEVARSHAGAVMRRWLSGEESDILKSVVDVLSRSQAVFDTTPMKATLARILEGEGVPDAFAHPENTLVVATTKLADGKPELMYRLRGGVYQLPKAAKRGRYSEAWTKVQSLDMLQQALMGTAALPMLFRDMEGRFDGGVLLNQPIAPAVGLGARVIYVFIPSPVVLGPTQSLPELVQTLTTTLLATSLEAQVRQIAVANRMYLQALDNPEISGEQREIFEQRIVRLCVIRPENALPAGLLGFGDHVQDMIATGYEDAKRRLKHFNYAEHFWWDACVDEDGILL